jgi:ABC-type antimicrobial peptide transport system permease subunit
MADSLLPVRLGAILLSVFGGIGLSLAAIGLYGVMAYVVSHRTKEIGIRLALGAQPSVVVMAVLRQGMTLTAVGIAIGTLIGSAITTVVAVELYGLTPADVGTLLAVVLGQAGVALLACWVPARRATRISPLLALRHQ